MSKVALLTGASGGLGKFFAEGLSKSGYELALCYYSKQDNIAALEEKLKTTGVKYKSYQADITDETSVQKLIETVTNDFGKIDILINNAGLSIDGVSWKLPVESFNKVLAVNLTGPFLCIKHTLPLMKQNGWGRIINISSVVSQTGVPGTVAYAVSKSGLQGLTKTIAKEATKGNITCNTIALGYFKAGMLYTIPEDLREQIKNTIPKKEFGEPDEIVNCIKYLCSDESSYLTGQTININGGLY